jgi:chitinase
MLRLLTAAALLAVLIWAIALQLRPSPDTTVGKSSQSGPSAGGDQALVSPTASQQKSTVTAPASRSTAQATPQSAPTSMTFPTRGPTPSARPTAVPNPTTTAAPTPRPTPTPTPTPGLVSWSASYYPGWQQAAHPPATLPWKAVTELIQFSVMTSASRDGSINSQAHSLTPTFMQAAVAEAHRQHRKVLLSIGGAEDNNFDAACNPTNRSKFIGNLVNLMQSYGYDGIDLDIEQDFGAPAHTDYIACVAGVRAALDRITPRPMLTMAADPDWQANMAAPVAQYVDQINLMTYWADVTVIPSKLANYTRLGVPKAKLGVGLGTGSDGGIDTTAAACGAKTLYVVNNRYGGVMEWEITDDQALHGGQTPCLDAVAIHVPQ